MIRPKAWTLTTTALISPFFLPKVAWPPNKLCSVFQKKHIKELNSLKAKDCLPFTFLKEQVGSYFTLESAANPGYFIYTSNKPGQPIGMTKELGQEKNIHFQFQEVKMELNTVQDWLYQLTVASLTTVHNPQLLVAIGPESQAKPIVLSHIWFCDLMNGSMPGSSVHGIFQTRILERAAISSCRGSSWPRDQAHVSYISCITGGFFTHWAIGE